MWANFPVAVIARSGPGKNVAWKKVLAGILAKIWGEKLKITQKCKLLGGFPNNLHDPI